MIKVLSLNKRYGAKQILCDINVSFENGKIIGIIGENGAGKTTLFRCISGLETFEGTIEPTLTAIRGQLGYLPTEPFFFDYMTGLEYVLYVCNARSIHMADIEERNIFELPLNQYASTYSTGMKKKLALMAVLLQNNNLFILDEPFNGVDIQSNMLIIEILKKLRDKGKTIIISSHIFSLLNELCDGIFHLDTGKLSRMYISPEFAILENKFKGEIIEGKINKLIL